MDSRYTEYVLNTWPQCYRQGLPGRQWYRVLVFTYIQTDVRADHDRRTCDLAGWISVYHWCQLGSLMCTRRMRR